ncbi:MAG: hypothetical protein JXB30_05025 [Anaerolineae bacterium]|nr:hypothetical protein [Anaerolineae bacterium]
MTEREVTENPFDNSSPFDALERSRRESFLRSFSATSVPMMSPVLAVYIWMFVSSPSWQIALVCVLTVLMIGANYMASWFARRQKAVLGSYIFLFSTLFIIGIDAVMIEGLTAVLPLSYAVIVIMAGMLLGSSGSIVIATASAFLWVLAQIVSERCLLPSVTISSTLLMAIIAVITIMGFFFTAYLNHLATKDLQGALDNATYDLVQANRKLGEANRLKSQFLARTSHELRTPLNAIIGYTDLTLRRVYGSLTAMQEDGLKRVLGNAKRLQSLINDILDLSKIEAGEMELIASPFNVKALVDAVDVAVGEAARKKGLEFSVSLAPDMPEKLIGDEIRTAQVLLNIADNAVKFTVDGQVDILIGLVDDEHWHMEVRDTGRGIAEENYERIFDEFRQLSTPGGTRTAGSGLGLSVARHLVHKMGGEIRIDSEIGRGSTFDVILPLWVAEKAHTQL